MFQRKTKPKDTVKVKNGKNILPGAFMMALIAAVVLYFVMLNAEKTALSEYEKAEVYVTVTSIPEGELITDRNFDTYFQAKQIDKKHVPYEAVTTKTDLSGKAPYFAMEQGMVITQNMFRDINEIRLIMENPREMGIGTADLSQIVSGVIRAGDLVDIYIIEKEETSEMQDGTDNEAAQKDIDPSYENVYVTAAFDGSGIQILNSDMQSSCQRINVLLENKDVFGFYEKIQNGTVYVVKITE